VNPRVSVICPTYQRSRAIVPTLESVLRQDVRELELLVVSDGSTDDTDDVVRELVRADDRVQLLRIPHSGTPSVPRNYGLARARGEVVAYIDHDDEWRADHLQVLLALLDRDPIAATGCERVIAGRRLSLSALSLAWHPEIQLVDPMFEPSRVGHRAGLAEAVGGWRVSDVGLEDWDLWLRIADAGYCVTTSDEPTARLAMGPTTRRNSIPSAFHIVLGRFPTRAQAADAADALRKTSSCERLLAAARVDVLTWYRDLVTSPRFRWLARFDGWRVEALEIAVEEAFRADRSASWQAAMSCIGIVDGRGDHSVVLPLWCTTAEHAQRASVLIRRRQRHQLAELRRILGEHAAKDVLTAGIGFQANRGEPANAVHSAKGVLR